MKRGCSCLVALPFLLFGVLFAIVGGIFLASSISRVSSGVETEGVVVDLVTDDGSTYAPIIEFVASDGDLYRFRSNLSRSPAPDIGDSIRVIYDESDPTDASEGSAGVLWIFPGAFLLVGLLVIALGLWLGSRRGVGRVIDAVRAGTRSPIPSPKSGPEDVDGPSNRTSEPVDLVSSPERLTARFRRVEPAGPDGQGRFRYRVVARGEDGAIYFSEWMDHDPTTAILISGIEEMTVERRGDDHVIVDVPGPDD